jgi:hypothetical protein
MYNNYPDFLKVNLYFYQEKFKYGTEYYEKTYEVKSGKSGKLKSLHMLLRTFPNVENAYVLTEDKYGEIPEQKIKFRPLFCAATFEIRQIIKMRRRSLI